MSFTCTNKSIVARKKQIVEREQLIISLLLSLISTTPKIVMQRLYKIFTSDASLWLSTYVSNVLEFGFAK